MIDNVTVRNVSVGDADDICLIQQETWRDTYISDDNGVSKNDIFEYTESWATPDNVAMFERLIQKSNKHTWLVAEIYGKVVGHVKILNREDSCLIDMFYVNPKYQGMGVGRLLLDRAMLETGMNDIVVDVVSYNTKAIMFYKSYNFRIIGKEKNSANPLPSGKVLPLIRMVRDEQHFKPDTV